jgi:hypothetical protein
MIEKSSTSKEAIGLAWNAIYTLQKAASTAKLRVLAARSSAGKPAHAQEGKEGERKVNVKASHAFNLLRAVCVLLMLIYEVFF